MGKKKLLKTVRTASGDRRYNVKEYLLKSGFSEEEIKKSMRCHGVEIIEKNTSKIRYKICYCRVSTHSQKDDLERQILYMKSHYPEHILIKDIGSGINFKRKGLIKIIDYCVKGQLEEIIVAYKDRLCRFGFDLIELLIKKYSNGKIIILNASNESPQEELTTDLVSIINVFSAKLNGMRKYKKTN